MKIPVVSKDCHDGNSVSFFTLELFLLTGNTLPMLVGKLSTIRLGLSVRNFRLSDRFENPYPLPHRSTRISVAFAGIYLYQSVRIPLPSGRRRIL